MSSGYDDQAVESPTDRVPMNPIYALISYLSTAPLSLDLPISSKLLELSASTPCATMSVNHAESYLYLKALNQNSPWSILDKLWTPLMGYPPEMFEVVEGTTPMATLKETAILIATYYFIIFAGREIMRDRPAFKLNDPFLLHNFCLTVISGALLALFLEQLVPTLWNHGVFHSICGAGGWTPHLTTLYYVTVSWPLVLGPN